MYVFSQSAFQQEAATFRKSILTYRMTNIESLDLIVSIAIALIVIPVIDYWPQTEIVNCNLDRIDTCLQNLSMPNFPIWLHFVLDHSLLINFLLAT